MLLSDGQTVFSFYLLKPALYLAMLITGEIRIFIFCRGVCPNRDAAKQAVLIVFLVVMLVVLYCVVNMNLALERALIQVARIDRQTAAKG